jgi:glycosyltransferase involved in cell wall biosynthesis
VFDKSVLNQVWNSGGYRHLDVTIRNLHGLQNTPEIRFKLFNASDVVGLEFRHFEDWPDIFAVWPGQEVDTHGELYKIAAGQSLDLSRFTARERLMLADLIAALPDAIAEAAAKLADRDTFLPDAAVMVHAFAHVRAEAARLTEVLDPKELTAEAQPTAPRLPEHVRSVLAALETAELTTLATSPNPLPDRGNPIVISVVKNEVDRLVDFLRHYRDAGVERFCFIDNGSTDGTLDYLFVQPDTDVFQHLGTFDWIVKQSWINRAIRHYGLKRWYMCVDADEHVVFDGLGRHSFAELAALMEAAGITRVRGLLVDMYADGALTEAKYSAGGDLKQAFPFYDKDNYVEGYCPEIMSVKGGPRARVFGGADEKFKPELTKYPLFCLGPDEYMANPHHIWPYDGNFESPRYLAIMHFKFLPGMTDKIRAAIESEAYWGGSLEYKCYAKVLAETPGISMVGPISAIYGNPQDFVTTRLIEPLPWARPSSGQQDPAPVPETGDRRTAPLETPAVGLSPLAASTTERVPPAAAVPPSDRRAHGEWIETRDGRLLGWAILPEARTKVLITIDGELVMEIEARGVADDRAGGNPKMRMHGFDAAVPSEFVKPFTCRIAAYDATDGQRIHNLTKTVSLKAQPGKPADVAKVARPPAPPLPPQAAPAAAVGVGALVGKDAATKRLAVVAWDMCHNPVGRAFLLADMMAREQRVELVGPTFQFYGGQIWPPIAGSNLPIRSFPATDMRSLVAGAVELANTITCDAVVVGKPRLASLLIGALIREKNNCPMIIDIDDHELSFVKNRTPLSLDDLELALAKNPAEAEVPYGELWTRLAESLVVEADSRIVSNVALRRKFGGLIVRHGRDEAVFEPALYDRRKTRLQFGYQDADRVLLFLGTPRPHKGIFDLCDALERVGDPRLALCVIGSIADKRMLNRFSAYKNARITLHPDQPWERLPELVNMADAVAILQDPSSPITEFQIPAKLTDALAMNMPVLATPVPPLEDVALTGALQMVATPEELDAAVRRLVEQPEPDGRDQGRQLFLSEFSYRVNRARLGLAVENAGRHRRTETPRFERLFRLLEKRTGIALPRLDQRWRSPHGRRLPVRRDVLPDLVFLWKQNDSDVYGRRSDMIVRYLLRTKRVGRIIHFDAPISGSALDQHAAASAGEIAHQGNLVYINTVRRILRAADTPKLIRRTFLHRGGSRPERALGQDLPPRDAYDDFIRSVLREVGVSNPILWTCPVVPQYAAALDAIAPAFIVADVIDDQRTFPGSSETYRRQVIESYDLMLGSADAVFSNCEPVREAFVGIRPDIKVVPNGAELFPNIETWEPAGELAGLPRPIIGYVGNLRDRVDLDLIEAVAEQYPHGSVVLVGSAHGRPEVGQLAARHANVRLLGVKPYDEAQRIIRGFDVAIMPHIKNDQSDRMNPLKLYVYFAVGVPVVTTDVANIGDLAPYINVAPSQPEFLAAIAAVLAGHGREISSADRAGILAGVSWEARISEIWGHLEHMA